MKAGLIASSISIIFIRKKNGREEAGGGGGMLHTMTLLRYIEELENPKLSRI